MDTEEARLLLPMYADGLLDSQEAANLESVLAANPELRQELAALQEENALITEALAPLNPSRSARMKLSEAMQLIHYQAESVANAIPQRDWRIFRICLALLGIAGYVYAYLKYPLPVMIIRPESVQETGLSDTSWATYPFVLGPLILGELFLLGAEYLAQLETLFMAKLLGKKVERSRLQVIALEIFGLSSMVIAGIVYLFMLKM